MKTYAHAIRLRKTPEIAGRARVGEAGIADRRIETWQPYYEKRLTDADSLEILLALSRLIDAAQQRMFLEN